MRTWCRFSASTSGTWQQTSTLGRACQAHEQGWCPLDGQVRIMKLIIHPDEQTSPKEALCCQVLALLGDEYMPSHVVFDLADYSDSPSFLNEFRDIGFSWTPDRPTDKVPSYLLEVMRDPSCTRLVWLSRAALAYSDRLFVWVFAHELRHTYQCRNAYPRDCIRVKVHELRLTAGYRELPPSVFAPEEIDSELRALRAVAAFFGQADLESFLVSKSLPRCPYPAYTRLLEETASACPG